MGAVSRSLGNQPIPPSVGDLPCPTNRQRLISCAGALIRQMYYFCDMGKSEKFNVKWPARRLSGGRVRRPELLTTREYRNGPEGPAVTEAPSPSRDSGQPSLVRTGTSLDFPGNDHAITLTVLAPAAHVTLNKQHRKL